MSAHPNPAGPAREVIAPSHVSLRKEVGRDAGPPPLEYGEVRLWLVSKEPHSVFAYWEFRPEEHPEALGADGRPRFFLRILRESEVETTLEIDPTAGKSTATVQQAAAQYHAELGFYNEQGVWCFLARSGQARTPPEDASAVCPPAMNQGTNVGKEGAPGVTGAWTPEEEARLNSLLAEDVARNVSGRKPPLGS